MMTGVVTADREATIRLIVRGREGREIEVGAVLDTGFNGSLTLPSPLVVALDLAHTASPWPCWATAPASR
jgi:predicted aspartyl protease